MSAVNRCTGRTSAVRCEAEAGMHDQWNGYTVHRATLPPGYVTTWIEVEREDVAKVQRLADRPIQAALTVTAGELARIRDRCPGMRGGSGPCCEHAGEWNGPADQPRMYFTCGRACHCHD